MILNPNENPKDGDATTFKVKGDPPPKKFVSNHSVAQRQPHGVPQGAAAGTLRHGSGYLKVPRSAGSCFLDFLVTQMFS